LKQYINAPKIEKCIINTLLHPTRNVCGIYWKMYNMLYVRAQDALVLAYPRLAAEVDTPQAPAACRPAAVPP
jgi:splicing factor 3B subunit 1